MFSEVAEIAVELLKTQVILMLNFTRPYAITYTKLNKKKNEFLYLYSKHCPIQKQQLYPNILNISIIREGTVR